MSGWIKEPLLEIGLTIKCMGKEYSIGQMAQYTAVNIISIKNRDKEPSLGTFYYLVMSVNKKLGLMDRNMMVSGLMGNSMGKVLIQILKEWLAKEFGKMERILNGVKSNFS